MPLGSLTELLTPPMLPGPCGIPLTPASCARDFIGAVKLATNAKAKKADLPNIGDSPVRVPNEPAGSPFLVRMIFIAGCGFIGMMARRRWDSSTIRISRVPAKMARSIAGRTAFQPIDANGPELSDLCCRPLPGVFRKDLQAVKVSTTSASSAGTTSSGSSRSNRWPSAGRISP